MNKTQTNKQANGTIQETIKTYSVYYYDGISWDIVDNKQYTTRQRAENHLKKLPKSLNYKYMVRLN